VRCERLRQQDEIVAETQERRDNVHVEESGGSE